MSDTLQGNLKDNIESTQSYAQPSLLCCFQSPSFLAGPSPATGSLWAPESLRARWVQFCLQRSWWCWWLLESLPLSGGPGREGGREGVCSLPSLEDAAEAAAVGPALSRESTAPSHVILGHSSLRTCSLVIIQLLVSIFPWKILAIGVSPQNNLFQLDGLDWSVSLCRRSPCHAVASRYLNSFS